MTIDFRGHVNNTVLSLYRVFAIISLYAVLAGVVVFAFGAAFYAASHTWIAPVILSSEDKDTLDLTGKVTTTVNTVEDLKLDIIHLQKQLDEAQNHRAELHSLLPELEAAIQRERIHNSVTNKVQAESDNTEALIRLQKQSGWDLQLSGGVHRQLTQITPDVSATGLYGTFNLVYNLGHHAAGKHLDKSATTYADWKDKQFDEVVNQATILKKQLNATLTAQLGQLKVLSSYDEALQKDIVSLGTIDTSNVIAYRSQLLADQIVLHVDIGDMQFRIARLQEYLTTNF